MATTTEKVKLPNGSSGEVVLPSGSDRAGAVVVLHEWWGVNDHIRSWLGRVAGAGYVAVAPDLYHGKVTTDGTEASELMTKLDKTKALADIESAVNFARAHERSNGRVAVMGFCMGGALAFAAAARVRGLSAVVPFYGFPSTPLDYERIEAPILAHFAAHDEWAKPELAQDAKRELEARRKTIELHVYNAQHAFANDTRPEVHDPVATQLAWERTLEFLQARLR